MAHTKARVRKRAMIGIKTMPQPHQPRMGQKGGKTPRIGIKNLAKSTGRKKKKEQEPTMVQKIQTGN